MNHERYIIKESTLNAIGNSLRTKTKTTKKLKPEEFKPLLDSLYSDATAVNTHIRANKRACTATAVQYFKEYQSGKPVYEYRSGEDVGTMINYDGAKIGGILKPGSGQGSADDTGSEGLEIEGSTLVSYGTCTDSRIIVPEGITTIGAEAFIRNFSLEAVVLPSTVTRIEEKAFAYCRKLQNINLPENLTFLGDDAFY